MVGWLTALLIALLAIARLSVREHATFDASTPTGEGLVNSVSPEFQMLLDVYATNYKSYIRNQDVGSKVASTQAEAQIEAVLDDMRSQINQNQFFIQTFLDDYQNTNPELESLHLKAQKLQEDGPKVADELVTTMQDGPPPVNYGDLVTRLIVLAVVLGVALAINAYASPES